MKLTEICADIKNYFCYEKDIHIGDFSIVNGQISPHLDLPTDYIRIVGSRKNDGVHCLTDTADELIDEGEFHGSVWIMSPPADFLALAQEISDWRDKNCGIDSLAMSPFNSENFGGYSYSKSGGASGGEGANWQAAYRSRLNIYRRIRVI